MGIFLNNWHITKRKAATQSLIQDDKYYSISLSIITARAPLLLSHSKLCFSKASLALKSLLPLNHTSVHARQHYQPFCNSWSAERQDPQPAAVMLHCYLPTNSHQLTHGPVSVTLSRTLICPLETRTPLTQKPTLYISVTQLFILTPYCSVPTTSNCKLVLSTVPLATIPT